MKTTLTYNGITLNHCLTKVFDQEAVYDDSGTDYLYTRFRLSVVGFIHAFGDVAFNGSSEFTGPGATPVQEGGSASIQEVYVRHALMEPRKRLVYRFWDGAEPILDAEPATDSRFKDCDVNNGPKPESLRLTRIVADRNFRAEYTIVVCKVECFENGADASRGAVLNNRWRCTDQVDGNWYTTRTTEGKLTLSTSYVNPHSFRHIALPRLSSGFKREAMHFVASEDGLHLAYTIVDREVPFAAPHPATSWSVSHTETVGSGMLGMGECAVRLDGPRNANKAKMISIAAAIIAHKLAVRTASIVKLFSITDLSGDSVNAIEARANVQHLPTPKANDDPILTNQDITDLLGRVGKRIGRPVTDQISPDMAGYNPDISRAPGPRGPIDVIQALSTHLQSACDLDDHSHQELGIAANDPPDRGQDTTTITASVVPTPEDVPSPRLSTDHTQALYTYFQAVSQYRFDSLKVAMPVGRNRGATSGADVDTTVVRLGPKQCRRTLRISVERVGKPPQLPVPETYADENGIRNSLMDYDIHPHAVDLTADGQEIHRIEAEYVFALSRAPSNTEQLRLPSVPWLSSSTEVVGSDVLTGPRA